MRWAERSRRSVSVSISGGRFCAAASRATAAGCRGSRRPAVSRAGVWRLVRVDGSERKRREDAKTRRREELQLHLPRRTQRAQRNPLGGELSAERFFADPGRPTPRRAASRGRSSRATRGSLCDPCVLCGQSLLRARPEPRTRFGDEKPQSPFAPFAPFAVKSQFTTLSLRSQPDPRIEPSLACALCGTYRQRSVRKTERCAASCPLRSPPSWSPVENAKTATCPPAAA